MEGYKKITEAMGNSTVSLSATGNAAGTGTAGITVPTSLIPSIYAAPLVYKTSILEIIF